MQNFQQNLEKLEAADTQVLGVSMDSMFSNNAWTEKINVTFPLLSDWGGEVTKEYGLYNPQYKAARRVNYLIDKSGKSSRCSSTARRLTPRRLSRCASGVRLRAISAVQASLDSSAHEATVLRPAVCYLV